MHLTKKISALALSLFMMLQPVQAEVAFLVSDTTWYTKAVPLEVMLEIDLGLHMPYDQERTAMLATVTDRLAFRLVAGENEGLVGISVADQEVLTLQYRDNAMALSSMPDTMYTASEEPLSLLLGENTSVGGGYGVLGLAQESEALLSDGRAMIAAFPAACKDSARRSPNTSLINGIGTAAYRVDYTLESAQMKAVMDELCPEGQLAEILCKLSFADKQTVRMHYSSEDMLMRVEYQGVCGMDNDLRNVKLVYKTRHDEVMDKEIIELTAPAKKGKNRNQLSFERTVQIGKTGVRTLTGAYQYTVAEDDVTSTWAGSFDLKNAAGEHTDAISGEMTFKQKLNNANVYDMLTLKPALVLNPPEDGRLLTGTVEVIKKHGGIMMEQALLSIDAKQAGLLPWSERTEVVNLSALNDQELLAVQQEAAASMAAALVRPLIVSLGKEAQWFFRDLPEDAIQSIIDAANAAPQR